MHAIAQSRPRRLQVVAGGEGGVTRGAEGLPDIGRVGVVALGAAEVEEMHRETPGAGGAHRERARPGVAFGSSGPRRNGGRRSRGAVDLSGAVQLLGVLLEELGVAAAQVDAHAVDPHRLDLGGDLERIASVMITVADFPGVIDP